MATKRTVCTTEVLRSKPRGKNSVPRCPTTGEEIILRRAVRKSPPCQLVSADLLLFGPQQRLQGTKQPDLVFGRSHFPVNLVPQQEGRLRRHREGRMQECVLAQGIVFFNANEKGGKGSSQFHKDKNESRTIGDFFFGLTYRLLSEPLQSTLHDRDSHVTLNRTTWRTQRITSRVL